MAQCLPVTWIFFTSRGLLSGESAFLKVPFRFAQGVPCLATERTGDMTRLMPKLAAGAAALALISVPSLAFAAPAPTVDADKGQVAYSFDLAFSIPGTDSAKPLRSPLSPGSNDEENYVKALNISPDQGTVWSLFVNSPTAHDDDRPPTVQPKPTYKLSAGLADNLTPQASVATDYKLEDGTLTGRGVTTPTFVYADTLRSAAQCPSAKDAKADSTVAGFYVRQPDGQLTKIATPAGGASYTVTHVPMKAPTGDTTKSDVFGDIAIQKVTDVGDLIKTANWRTGDVNAASGWRVQVDNYVLDGNNKKTDLGVSTVILGGVSCSIPKDFVAQPVTPPTTTTHAPTTSKSSTPTTTKPSLPVTIAAGDGSTSAGSGAGGVNLLLPIAGAAAAVLTGGVALTVARRRREASPPISE